MSRRFVFLLPTLVVAAAFADLHDTQRQLALISPTGVADAFRDMAQRWPERCGGVTADRAW